MDLNQVVRQQLHFIWLLKYRREAVLQVLLMQSMLLTLYMLRILVLTLIIYIFRSLTVASRHLRLQRLW